MKKFQDCYSEYKNSNLIIGNNSIERVLSFKKIAVSLYLKNKKTKKKWENKNHYQLIWNFPGINYRNGSFNVTVYNDDNNGLSHKHLAVEILYQKQEFQQKTILRIFPELPFITSRIYFKGPIPDFAGEEPDKINSTDKFSGIEKNYQRNNREENSKIHIPEIDTIESLAIDNTHLKLETIELQDVTDKNDYLIKKHKQPIYVRGSHSFTGNIFIIDDYLNKEGLMLVKEGPTKTASLNRKRKELQIESKRSIELIGSGIDFSRMDNEEWIPAYGSTTGVGSPDKLKRLYKSFYNRIYKGDKKQNLFIMSNTWGDRNQDIAVSEEFIKKEIDTGAEIGIDIVQIDDGWEKGTTSNSALQDNGVWEGYYDFDSDFWEVDQDKFPDGLKPVVSYAKEKGIEIGLWFSPDSSGDFSNWEKDAEVLLDLYKKFNIKYFKLDGIKIRSKKCELNLIKLMEKVNQESNNEVSFNLDITAEVRFGYLYEKKYGSIFV
ncbi:MAG: glycoside hydrolase family 97 catalytic domain-containing protein, partial [Halanaerobiales bacterium]